MNRASVEVRPYLIKSGAALFLLVLLGGWMLSLAYADYTPVGGTAPTEASLNTPLQDRPQSELIWMSEQTLAHLRDFLERLEPLPGQGPEVEVRNVHIDGSTGIVHVDMSADFLDLSSEILGFQWEDQMASINSEVEHFLRPWVSMRGVDFTFDGFPMEHYHQAEQTIFDPTGHYKR